MRWHARGGATAAALTAQWPERGGRSPARAKHAGHAGAGQRAARPDFVGGACPGRCRGEGRIPDVAGEGAQNMHRATPPHRVNGSVAGPAPAE